MEWKSDLETRLKWDWQDRREKSKQAPKKRNAIRVGNAGKHGWGGPRVICSVKSEEFSKADCRILALSSQSRLSKQFRSSLLQWNISQAFQLEYEELCNEVPWSRSQELLSFGLNRFRLHSKTLTHLSSSILTNPGSLDHNHFFLKGARVASWIKSWEDRGRLNSQSFLAFWIENEMFWTNPSHASRNAEC